MICENLQKRVALLPNEIQYKIISYSNNPQDPRLCEDIKDYYDTLTYLYEYYYSIYIMEWGETEPEDKNWLINDIYGYMNDYYPICLGYRKRLCDIINRSFVYRYWSNRNMRNMIDKFVGSLNKKGVGCEINLLWGLLSPEERNHFINYSVKNIDITGNDLIGENLLDEEEEEEEEEEDWDF